MENKNKIIIGEDKIKLRRLEIEDSKVLAPLANNKKIWDNLRDFIPHPYSENDAINFIESCSKQEPPSTFAITFQNELSGVISLIREKDVHRKSAEIGYWIGEPFWGKGIMSEAVKLMTAYGFNSLHLVRIHAGIYEYNLASMKVLEKNNYQKEGVFKINVFKNGKFHDEYRYAIINPKYL